MLFRCRHVSRHDWCPNSFGNGGRQVKRKGQKIQTATLQRQCQPVRAAPTHPVQNRAARMRSRAPTVFLFYAVVRKGLEVNPILGLFIETLMLLPLTLTFLGWLGWAGQSTFLAAVQCLFSWRFLLVC